MKYLYIILALVTSQVVAQQVYFVAPSGNDANNGTEQSPLKTVTKALTLANTGAEIVLRAGTYNESVKVQDENITIRSFEGETATIATSNTNGSPDQTIWFQETGGKLININVIGGFYYAIKFEKGDALVKNCRIHDSGRDCVKIVPGANNITIEQCEIYNSGQRDDSNAEGIDNVNGDGFVLRESYIHDTGTTGVYVKGGGRNCLIERNLIMNTGNAGVLLGFFTDEEFYRLDNDPDTNPEYYGNIDGVVRNNIIVNTSGPGIGLFASINSKVYNNTLVNVARDSRGGVHFEPLDDDGNGTPTPVVNPTIVNNIVVMNSTRPILEGRKVGSVNSLSGSISINNNLYHRVTGTPGFSLNGTGNKNFTQWKADTGLDAQSLTSDPLLNTNYHLPANSPAIGKGQAIAANTMDYDRGDRVQPFDIGADQFGQGCATVTVPPAQGVIGTGVVCGEPDVVTDLPENKHNNYVYPSPTGYKLYVGNENYNKATFSINELNGRRLKSGTYTQEGIDISSLENGIYMLTLYSASGVISSSRFIVNK
jgi:hypothetical protein